MKETHPIEILSRRYPQLCLEIREGEKDTPEYKASVLGGEQPKNKPAFSYNENDRLELVDTPAGKAEILFLADRGDFEHAMRALAYRCEPVDIPKSNGASAISGIINWEKLRPHVDVDFEQFISDKSNYLDRLILLSYGDYSAVNAQSMELEKNDWLEKSVTVRKYHELTHFVSGKLFPDNKEAIRDEIIADMNGLIAAFGDYNTQYAKLFLGTETGEYRPGGRLQNYCDNPEETLTRANGLISLLSGVFTSWKESNPDTVYPEGIFDFLLYIEKNRIGIE